MSSPFKKQLISAASTPKQNKRSRVLVLQDEAKTMSPLRRLSRVQDMHEVQIEVYNDDVEKTLRREEANQQEKLTSALDTSLSTSINEEDLKNHFETCIKLFMENKINSKNAWNLKFIDYMRMATKSFKDPLQIGSTSLDVSSKVYSIRVDDIHSDGLKLASSMAKTTQKNADDVEEDADVDNEVATDQQQPKKKKRKVMRKKSTIATDPNTLLAPLTKLESMFFQKRQNIELSLIENLCTNKLSMDNSCCKFMLLSDEKFWPPTSFQEEDVINTKKMNINIPLLGNEKICAPFSNFDITEWDLRQEKFSQSSLVDFPVLDDLNNDALPMLELDGSVHDDSDVAIEENDNDNNQAMEADQEPPRIILSDFPKDTCEHIASLQCGKFIDNIWAGPSHWKLKCIKSAKSRFSGAQNKLNRHAMKRGAKTQQQEYIDMNISFDFDMEKHIAVKRKAKFVDKSEITIPLLDPDIEHVKNTILECTSKPGLKFYMNEESVTNLDDRLEPYNYDNPSDNDYCSQKTNEENVDNYEEHHDSGLNVNSEIRDENVISNENFVDNLIEAPEMVPKTYVPYALQAKKMDMRKLKSVIWDFLTRNSKVQNKIIPTTFAQLMKKLPLHLNEKMRKELTPHLTFTALLHLANEHSLKLVGQEDLKNLYISDN